MALRALIISILLISACAASHAPRQDGIAQLTGIHVESNVQAKEK